MKERVEKTLRDSLMHLRKKAGLRTTMNFQVREKGQVQGVPSASVPGLQ